jgi:hypothetical protein
MTTVFSGICLYNLVVRFTINGAIFPQISKVSLSTTNNHNIGNSKFKKSKRAFSKAFILNL